MSNVAAALQTDAYRQLDQTLQDAYQLYTVTQQSIANAQQVIANGPQNLADRLAAYNNAAQAVSVYLMNYVPPMDK